MAITADDSPGLIQPLPDPEWLEASRRRSPIWVEALVVVWLCWLYDEISNLSPVRLHTALAHAASILHVENVLHLNPELTVNTWAATHRAVALPMANFYDTAHFVVTLGVVAIVWWRRPDLYRPLRNSLVLINVIGFVVFWAYPLAPPRLMPAAGFIDVVAVTHAWGSWQTSAVASQANELAAMPSLHMAWACWTAAACWQLLARYRTRLLVLLYPVVTVLVVIGTGNHFLLDVIAGIVTFVAAVGMARLLADWRSIRPPLLALRRWGWLHPSRTG